MSRYDDPRWYEEQNKHFIPPNQSAFDDFDHYPFLPGPEQNAETPQANDMPPQETSRSRRYARIRQVLVTAILMVIAFFGGWFSYQYFGNVFEQNNQSRAYERLFDQAWLTVDQNYVDRKDVDYKKMSYAAIQAMVDTLQDKGHSRFMDPATVQSENQQLSGTFTGIGIYLQQDQNTKQLIISSTIVDAPADKAGIKAGDVITAVNGTSVVGKSVADASSLIQGKAGTTVTLTIQRSGSAQPLNITVTRAVIQQPNVIMHYIPEDHVADIQIVQFASGVSNDLKNSLNQAKSMGAKKYILDLRNDPGGYLPEAINTVSLFVKNGNVLLEEDSTGQKTPVAVNGNAIDTTDQVVVLVNGNSASAAEIVTGALQDNHRAKVIGERTYGTGTVLQQFTLSDGSALLLGTQEWLTPNGRFIRGTSTTPGGLAPDVTVTQNANVPIVTPSQANQLHMTEQQILASGDAQLAAALHSLDGGTP